MINVSLNEIFMLNFQRNHYRTDAECLLSDLEKGMREKSQSKKCTQLLSLTLDVLFSLRKHTVYVCICFHFR